MTAPAVPEIRAVVDKSALESYARGHVHIGEIIREVADEENVFVAIPVGALLGAHAELLEAPRQRALLGVITTLPGVKVLGIDAEVADLLAGVIRVTNGDVARAHAVWTANRHGALFLTTAPDEFKSLVPGDNIISISTEDA